MIFNPKTEVYKTLRELGYKTIQGSQAVFNETPCITFTIQHNSVNLDLDNQITHQDIIVNVDIWADGSKATSAILAEVEAKMRSIFYQMTSSLDVPNPPDPSLFHIACSFRAIKPNK